MSDIKKVLIEFMDNIRDYVRESGRNLAHDDRESEEFVDIFIQHNPELFKPKRKPLADGTLELTESELEELGCKRYIRLTVLGYGARSLRVKKIVAEKDCICIIYVEETGKEDKFTVFNYKAIAHLLDKFDLEI